MHEKRVVLLLGAGATVADAGNLSAVRNPPLDKRFFIISSREKTSKELVERVGRYMRSVYDMDILQEKNDSLEQVMAQIYTDITDPSLQDRAIGAFRTLIYLFNKRLADTTNDITPTQGRVIYRIVRKYLSQGIKPDELVIVTFNQDLQIEKSLHHMMQAKQWKTQDLIWAFPGCYRVDIESQYVTGPTSDRTAVFDSKANHVAGVPILKLHGSLNWYSSHISAAASIKAMFKPDRKIRITTRMHILTDMRLRSTQRSLYTLPVVVPPVTHKSPVLHNKIRPLWRIAEERLREANEVTIVGYSCPELDFESCNLIRRSLGGRKERFELNIVDPSSVVLKRYIDLINPRQCQYYPQAGDFLKNRSQ